MMDKQLVKQKAQALEIAFIEYLEISNDIERLFKVGNAKAQP